MSWFWEHGNEIFILFLIPIVGLILDLTIDKKRMPYILGISIFLLLPILTGYKYIIPYLYQILGLTAFSSLYTFYSRQIENKKPKIISSILLTGLLFIILGFFAFMDSISGYQKIENSWKIDNYKIDYVTDQGFAGGALMRYEISKYSFIPILIKQVDYAVDNDTTNSCLVHFTDVKLDFDKCKTTLTDTKKRQ
jgi:hypothetical protein